jgi:hypothetical protein
MTNAVNIAQGGSNNVTFRNRIINGGMVIDQRNAGASVTATTTTTYSVDRWKVFGSQNSKFTIQQSSTAPSGFINSVVITSSSAYAVQTGEQFWVRQDIEGFNVADLGWGTANAKTVTLSFQVYSSLTGTFGGSFRNDNADRSYPFSYTISSANTWTSISVTVAGDTNGTWLKNNGAGISLFFGLGVASNLSNTAGAWASGNYVSATGATSVVGTNGATFYITGVQLEAGTTASPFEYRQYGTELQLCQRYFQRTTFDTGDYPLGFAYAYSNNTCASSLALAVPMRAQPTAAIVVNMGIRGGGFSTSQTLSSLGAISFSNGIGSGLYVLCNPTTSGSSLTSYTTYLLSNIASGGFTLSAEL